MMRFCLISLSLLQAISCRSTNNRDLKNQKIEIVDDFGETTSGLPPETIVIIDSGPQLDELQLAGRSDELVEALINWMKGQSPSGLRRIDDLPTPSRVPEVVVKSLDEMRATRGVTFGRFKLTPDDNQKLLDLINNVTTKPTKVQVEGRQFLIAEVSNDLDANLAAWSFLRDNPKLTQVHIVMRDESGIRLVGRILRDDLPDTLRGLNDGTP